MAKRPIFMPDPHDSLVVEESIEDIRALIDDFDEYNSEEDWG